MDKYTAPITFQIYQNQERITQFDEGFTILFGLHGNSFVLRGKKEYELESAGILVINPFEMYQITCMEGDVLLCMRISRSMMNISGWNPEKQCSCYQKNNRQETEEYKLLRSQMAEIFVVFFQQNQEEASVVTGTAVQLIQTLDRYFSVRASSQAQKDDNIQRMKRILDKIHERWNEDLSLKQIAAEEFLSVGYMSRFFQKYLNRNFSQYIKELRLSHAAQMLVNTGDSVTRIAYDCGFRTPSAFIEVFKQKYDQTPGQFRDAQKPKRNQQATGLPQTDLRNDISVLLDYLPEKKEQELQQITESIIIDCSNISQKISNDTILNIGYARDGLMAPVQEQIRRAQKDIGFRYIRFHGLLDDDMHIYWEHNDGTPEFHFSYVDMLFDFILSTGLIPYVELSFVPSVLAMEQTRIYDRPSVISGCRDIEKWKSLIHAVLEHFIVRYGRCEVRKWKFTTISQSYVHLGCIDWDSYKNMYKSVWDTAKELDCKLSIGGPGCFAEMVQKPEGAPEFLEFAKEQGCMPDFISIQSYPSIQNYDPLFLNFTMNQQSAPAVLSEDTDFLAHELDALQELMEQKGIDERRIFLEECTSTLWQRDISSDTCYKSVWITKNRCDCAGRAVFGYWLLTDFMEERARLENTFHGGYGLITYNGIPKAGYHAMSLFQHMGSALIDKGDGWMMTREEDTYQLIVYNYSHYSSLYRYRYQRLKKPEDAYTVFETGKRVRMQIRLDGLEDGIYQTERIMINREHGSSFDLWIKTGKPQSPTQDEIRYLSEGSQPIYRTEYIEVQDGVSLEFSLNPLEVELIVLKRKV